MKIKTKNITELIAYLYIILFLYTGISKLTDYAVFKEQIATSPLLSNISSWIAIGLPLLELLIAILLFIPKGQMKGLHIALSLMILFTVYIIYILNFNETIPCSCGGVLEMLSWKAHIVFNLIFIVLAILAILLGKRRSTTINTTKDNILSYN